jgi:hypothetical protein
MSEQLIYTASLANRRRARRCIPSGQVRMECRKGMAGLGRNVAVTTLDLSETGARLTVRATFTLGEVVEIQLAGPGVQRPVKRSAKIAWLVLLKDGSGLPGCNRII